MDKKSSSIWWPATYRFLTTTFPAINLLQLTSQAWSMQSFQKELFQKTLECSLWAFSHFQQWAAELNLNKIFHIKESSKMLDVTKYDWASH